MTYESFPAHRAAELVARGFEVIDVRDRSEYRLGHLSDARNVPLDELPHRLHEFSTANKVAVICQTGGRSASAAEILARYGVRSVVNLEGGMVHAVGR
jgi:rhodanese-related sulfurtransferase